MVTGAVLAAAYVGGYGALRGTDVLIVYPDTAIVITSIEYPRSMPTPPTPPEWESFVDPEVIRNASLRATLDTLYAPLVGAEIAIRRWLEC